MNKLRSENWGYNSRFDILIEVRPCNFLVISAPALRVPPQCVPCQCSVVDLSLYRQPISAQTSNMPLAQQPNTQIYLLR